MRVPDLVGRVLPARSAPPHVVTVADPLTAVLLDHLLSLPGRVASPAGPTAAERDRAARLAAAWRDGFAVEEVREWLDWCPHITPDVAAELALEGVTPREAAEQLWLGKRARHRPPLWSRVQFREITPHQAAEEVRRAHGA